MSSIRNMSSKRLYIVGKLYRIIPETRGFSFKASLLRWAGATIGENVRICSSVTFLGKGPLTIGNDVWVGAQTLIVASTAVKIGNHIDIAPRVFIGTGSHEVDSSGLHSAGEGISKPIVVEDGVWIGAASGILAGVTIGKKTIIAAGSMVIADTGEKMLYGGVPAKLIRKL